MSLFSQIKSGDYVEAVANGVSNLGNNSTQTSKQPNLGRGAAGSWLQTFQTLMGSRSHKPSFVIFDIGQSGCMTMEKWFAAHEKITFQPDILSQPVRFPRMSVYQRIRQSNGEVYGFSLTVEQLRQVQQIADPNQFLQDLHRGGCRVIYLNRRDALRHAIATLKEYSINCRFDGNEVSRPNKLTVDVSELIACLKYLDNQRVEANAILHDIPRLNLIYEDDLMDPNTYAATAQRLSGCLEIPNIRPVGTGMKLVHQRIADIVTNYDAVIEGVEASEYAYLLTSNRHLLTM